MLKTSKNSLIVIAGPTASGKSELAVKLAKKINGEIISADSRQVYKGLNIGSGKVEGKWQKISLIHNPLSLTRDKKPTTLPHIIPDSTHLCQGFGGQASAPAHHNFSDGGKSLGSTPFMFKTGSRVRHGMTNKGVTSKNIFIYKSIPHYCIDFVNPKKQYSVSDFKKDAEKAIQDIYSRGKIPIICGGTGHYIDAVVFNQSIPEVPPDKKFREKMEKKSAEELFALLQKKDPRRAENIDRNNKRRLIRALEIIKYTKRPVPLPTTYNLQLANLQLICLSPPREELYQKIEKRLKERVKAGMVEEAMDLHKSGLSWKRMEDLGLEYRHLAKFLKKNSQLSTKHLALSTEFLSSSHYQNLLRDIKHYSKRQETWFKKYKKGDASY